MYENYVFDLYGTLVDINTTEWVASVWKQMAIFYGYYGASYKPNELKKKYYELVSIDEAKLKKSLTKDMPKYAHEAFPEIMIEKVFKKLYELKGVKADKALVLHTGQFFRVISTKHINLYDGTFELLEAIKAAGKKVWLLSNAQRIFTEYEMIYLGIHDKFDGILISSDYKCKKPDERFYNMLKEKFDLDFSESIMIGNDATSDIAGARNVGMDTFFIYSNISPKMTEKEIENVEATYKLDHMDLFKVKEILNL